MSDSQLRVFSRESAGFPLRTLAGAMRSAEHPAELSLYIAGAATDEELDSTDWDAAFLRWREPELHDVALIERDLRGESEQAKATIEEHLKLAANNDDQAGQLIVADHLRRTEAIYTVQILPALLADDDHPAWGALDVVLRCIAAETEGLIAVPGEGYCDADGELLMAEIADDEDLEAP